MKAVPPSVETISLFYCLALSKKLRHGAAMPSSSSTQSRTSQLAEDLFGAYCSNADVVRNRVEDDQKGWDFFVQYAAEPSELPPDLRPPERACIVQVKSSRRSVRTWSLKLTNALRYANSDLPCFIALFILKPGQLEPKAIYLKHFWKDEIRGTLAAARQAHVDGITELHKVKFDITFDKADRRTRDNLIAKIAEAIDGVGTAYPAEKRKLRDAAGYEDGVAIGKFTLEIDPTSEDYMDFLLGRRSATVADLTVIDNRFGQEGHVVTAVGQGEITFEPEPQAICQIVIGPRSGDDELSLTGQVYAVPLQDIPVERRKARIQAGPLELILRYAGRQEAHVSSDMSELLDLPAVLTASSLLSWGSTPLTTSVWVDGRCLVQGELTLREIGGASHWLRLREVAKRLLNFMPADRWPAQARFSLLDMMQGLSQVARFAGLVSGGVTLSYSDVPDEDVAALHEMRGYLGCHWVELDQVTAVAIVTAPIKASTRPSEAVVQLGDSKIVHRSVLVGTVDQHRSYIEMVWRKAYADLAAENTLLCEPDFEAFATLKALRASPDTITPGQ